MDEAKYLQIKNAFEKNGGTMGSSDELDSYLDWRGADAATIDEKYIAFRQGSPPTASEMFEELIHTAQLRNAIVSTDNVQECELKAKEKLIKYQKQYDIPDSEHAQTVKQVEELKRIISAKNRW